MLKRQRPSSPFLPSSTPFIADSSDDIVDRTSKRRRTIPPALDGSSRGWASPPQDLEDDDEDYDDDYPSYNKHSNQHVELTELNPEYKSANAILRELHVLHQHRSLFSPPDTPSHSPIVNPGSNSTYPSTTSYHPEALSPPTKPHLQSPPLNHPRPTLSHTLVPSGKDGERPLLDEVDRVTERYESMNKRELDSPDEIPDR
ncbi:hypothetical protein CVT26_011900 [Gymnopilus dilepis]|uniref:Uncharacterized protein n=1 Tax=Gymnopilus dilepis TaxID=231916 RepID=A0A409WND2_9AGAR|nr:hypothetical protein CVT26_011900 [Gymnopilus dilepis]